MSFGLAVHNWRVLPIDGEVAEATDGTLIVLDVQPDYNEGYDQNVRGMLAAGTNGKVMWPVPGYTGLAATILFSSDYGETWSNIGLTLPGAMPQDSDTYISNLQYYQSDDTWYMLCLDLGPRRTYFFYSTDDGTTWTEDAFDNGTVALNYMGLGMDVSDGDWMAAGRATANNRGTYGFKSSPGGATTILGTNDSSTAYSTVKMGGKYYSRNLSSTGAASQYITILDFVAGTVQNTNGWASTTYGASNWSESDGSRFFSPKGTLTNVTSITLGVFTPDTDYTTVGSESNIVLSYPEPVMYCDTAYGNGWVSVAVDYEPEARYVYVHHSVDGLSWSATPLKFTLRTDITYGLRGQSGPFQVKWGGGSTWYLAGVANEGLFASDNSFDNAPIICMFSLDNGGNLTYPPPAVLPPPLLIAIEAQSPEIFYKLDDTGNPGSVVDLGTKQYPNVTAGNIIFEQDGLVSDGGKAALFGMAARTLSFSAEADAAGVSSSVEVGALP